ncbi:hypothetical protein PTTG_29684 [Puccinia triticina 1-1 BBBD Race 1]|uniref:CCHC-type domain-containing protein n=1 Tax=Puccinia triticina (isolate 1-1 / race 1 (BBBD)) TaxID=630390 RepID=A0A180G2F0_PUCT1|nr:hypothetical protein PTTG_29684 [Puccinia triticina 1-1 BBBD Race 1]
MEDAGKDLLDYEDDSVGSSIQASSSKTAGKIDEALTTNTGPRVHPNILASAAVSAPAGVYTQAVHRQPVPEVEVPELQLPPETDPCKVLKEWPKKDNPKFCGAMGESATKWLRTVEAIMKARRAHLGIWHLVASQKLSGKPFCDWTKALIAETRPRSWVSFKDWVLRLNLLATTPALLVAELDKLCQGPNEDVQSFYERFCAWQEKAQTIDFAHDEQTAFITRLTPGLTKRVQEFVTGETICGNPCSMDNVVMTAVANDQHYQNSQAAPVLGSSKRRADGKGGGERKKGGWPCHNCKAVGHAARNCPSPKTDEQKAWEKANQAKQQKKKE